MGNPVYYNNPRHQPRLEAIGNRACSMHIPEFEMVLCISWVGLIIMCPPPKYIRLLAFAYLNKGTMYLP